MKPEFLVGRGKIPKASKTGVLPKSPGQTAPTPKSENGDDATGASEDPDAILPVPEGEAPPRPKSDDNGDDDDDQQHPIATKP